MTGGGRDTNFLACHWSNDVRLIVGQWAGAMNLALIIGYIIWWLFTLSRGQTPGKRLVGIRVMRTDGTTSDWGWTFIREFLVKFAVFGVSGDTVAFGIPSILDHLWAFWDKDRQTLHDKIMKTVVVNDRVLRSRPHETLAEVA